MFDCPIKSKTVRQSLPSNKRNPLPSCCKNTVKLSVGLKNKIVFISGISTPSLNKSTVNINLSSPDCSLLLADALCSFGLSLLVQLTEFLRY